MQSQTKQALAVTQVHDVKLHRFPVQLELLAPESVAALLCAPCLPLSSLHTHRHDLPLQWMLLQRLLSWKLYAWA